MILPKIGYVFIILLIAAALFGVWTFYSIAMDSAAHSCYESIEEKLNSRYQNSPGIEAFSDEWEQIDEAKSNTLLTSLIARESLDCSRAKAGLARKLTVSVRKNKSQIEFKIEPKR